MSSLITADQFRKTLRQLQRTAKLKADMADEAFLKHADPRAIQGGAIDETASAWRELSRALAAAALKADAIEGED